MRPRVARRRRPAGRVGRAHLEAVVRLRLETGVLAGLVQVSNAAPSSEQASAIAARPVVGGAERERRRGVGRTRRPACSPMTGTGAVRSAPSTCGVRARLTFSYSPSSVARTTNVCSPRPRPVYVVGGGRRRTSAPSSEHSKVDRLVGGEGERRLPRVDLGCRTRHERDDRRREVGDLPLVLRRHEARDAVLDRLDLERVLAEAEVLVRLAATRRSPTRCPSLLAGQAALERAVLLVGGEGEGRGRALVLDVRASTTGRRGRRGQRPAVRGPSTCGPRASRRGCRCR